MKMRAVLLAMALSATAIHATAQFSQQPMKFTFHDPCGGGNSESCADVMVGQGVFDASTVPSFIAALKYHSREDKNSVLSQGVSNIIISSPGGSLAAGIALGLEIRRLRMNTTVVSSFNEWARGTTDTDYSERPILRNAKCLSACSYAMLGGVKRSVESENTLGVHQFNSTSTDRNLESNTQTTTAQLALYVERMGVLPGFMTLASLTKPDEITYVTKSQARDLQIDNVNISLSAWKIKATEGGVPIVFVNQKLSQSHSVGIVLLYQGKNLIVSTQMVFKGDAMRAARLNEFPLNTMPEISFRVNGKRFKGQATKQWASVNLTGVKTFESVSEFPVALLKALQQAKTVSITDAFPNAILDLSLNTDLSTNGLNSGASLLERSK
jgi:hypothetical protein